MESYESEHTKFIREWMATHPEEIQEQKRGRALWWDKKPQTPEVPVIVVEDATLPSMKKTSMTLAELQASSSSVTHGGPALILIGEVFGQDISTRTIKRSDEYSLPAPAASLCA